jgi:hypothetical protein
MLQAVQGTPRRYRRAIPSPSPVFVGSTAPYDLHLLVNDAPSGPRTTANRGCCIDQIPGTTPTPSWRRL